jgi:hypothetical protein
MKKFVLALSLLCLLAMSVTAGPLIVHSGSGSYGTQYNTGVVDKKLVLADQVALSGSQLAGSQAVQNSNIDLVVPASYPWDGPIPPSSKWISFTSDYTPTPGGGGNGTDTLPGCKTGSNYDICNGDWVSFYHEFSLGSGGFAGSVLKVLADDTANVWINGHQLFTANPSLSAGDFDTCSDVVIGCLDPKTIGVATTSFSSKLVANSVNVLVFQVFQRAGDGFGLNYSASIVPEPGFYGALALGLSGLYLVVRRRRQNS